MRTSYISEQGEISTGNFDRQPHFEKGSNTYIAFMFACPGWFESFHKRPASGDTGLNLHRLLQIMRDWHVPKIPTREDLTITNSWKEVMYAGKDGDTLPSFQQIKAKANVERLKKELSSVTGWVVCCGEEAQHAGSLLTAGRPPGKGFKLANIRHLSMQSVNQVKDDIYSLPINEEMIESSWHRSRARLEVVAKLLLTQLGAAKHVPTSKVLGQGITMIQRAWGEIVVVFPSKPTKEQLSCVPETIGEKELKTFRELDLKDKWLRIYAT